MNITDHYNTSYDIQQQQQGEQTHVERRPSLIDPSRTLYPISSFRHHPYQIDSNVSAHSSPSNSRRGSLTDPALHASGSFRPTTHSLLSFNSPPSSPSSRRSSMVTTPEQFVKQSTPPPIINNSNNNSPWRRESLPSITHLTNVSKRQPLPPPPVNAADYQFKHVSLIDNHRRHSIATTPTSTIRKSRQNSLSSRSYSNIPYEEDEDEEMASNTNTNNNMMRRGSEQTPYSRSPELRVSHKLAERKRRKEMKDLFDDLRDLLPVDKGLKTSKWEILSKTLEYIRILHEREGIMEREKQELISELNSLKR